MSTAGSAATRVGAAAIGLVPVRGGSVRVPRKNLALVAGRPLLLHTLDTAVAALGYENVYVCTEDNELAEVSLEYGVQVIRHPPELSQDSSPVIPVLKRAIEHLQSEKGVDSVGAVAVLRATSPLRSVGDVTTSISLLEEHGSEVDSVVGVTEVTGSHPSRFKTLDKQTGLLVDMFPEHFAEGLVSASSQSLAAYTRNSAILTMWPSTLVELESLWGHRVVAYVMPEERSLDVNSAFDLAVADLVATHLTATETS